MTRKAKDILREALGKPFKKGLKDYLRSIFYMNPDFIINSDGKLFFTKQRHYFYFKKKVLPTLPKKEQDNFPPKWQWEDHFYIWVTDNGHLCGSIEGFDLIIKIGVEKFCKPKDVFRFYNVYVITTLLALIEKHKSKRIYVEMYERDGESTRYDEYLYSANQFLEEVVI